jgi:hypothetical protein
MSQMKMMMGESVSSKPNYRYENKEYLLNTIMNQLGLTDEDLDQDTSWIKAKVRESNIDKVLNK